MPIDEFSLTERPELTFPEEEATQVASHYGSGNVVLEYGSGGSTALAAEIPGLRCFSVESDKRWAIGMRTWLDDNVPKHSTIIHYADIGQTGPWGWPRPINPSMESHYEQYPTSVWDREDFECPDVILIDGRFRVGCFLAAASRVSRPTDVLFDDYTDRPSYHVVERLFQPHALVGRMALFRIQPGAYSASDLTEYREAALNPE